MTYEEAEELLENTEGYLKGDKRWLEGLLIFKKYLPEFGNSYDLAAEHDVIYVCDFIEEMSKEDVVKLHEYGFHLDGDSGGWALFT